MQAQALLKKLVQKLAEKQLQTLLYTLAEKKVKALIFPFVARLTKVQGKRIGDTVGSIEKKGLVENLSDPLFKMKSWRRSTLSITR